MLKKIFKVLKTYKEVLTIKRFLNYLLVMLSLKLKSSRVYGMPLTLIIEPTNMCNLKCPLCPKGNGTIKKKEGLMSFDRYKLLIDELGSYAFNLILQNYGEPFLNPKIFKMIKYAKQKNLKVTISTNGYLFNEEKNIENLINSKLDELIVTLDGIDQKTLVKYRVGANFDVIINGIKKLVKKKNELNSKYPCIELQFIIMKHNENQIEKIKELAKQLGVDRLILKTVNIYENLVPKKLLLRLAKKFLPSEKKYRRYEIKDDKIVHKLAKKAGCPGLWIGTVINYDGNVVPCCYDAYEWHLFGNAFKEEFKKIWNNEKYRAFRKAVLKNKRNIKLCKYCPTNVENEEFARIDFNK